jgi:hypothetical protein
MGSREFNIHLGIVTIKCEPACKDQVAFGATCGEERPIVFRSRFDSLYIWDHCEVSWSGIGLPLDAGWHDVADGSLFVRSSSSVNSFIPTSETRDDIQEDGDKLVYFNGYRVDSSRTTSSALYHVILPQYSYPTKIEYVSCGKVNMVYARVMDARAILTWHYLSQIQLRITFSSPVGSAVKERDITRRLTRDHLYEVATKSLPAEPKTRLLDKVAVESVKGLISEAPEIVKLLGGF